jgi:hypothetical protein
MQVHVDNDIKLCFIHLQFGPQRCISGQTIYTYWCQPSGLVMRRNSLRCFGMVQRNTTWWKKGSLSEYPSWCNRSLTNAVSVSSICLLEGAALSWEDPNVTLSWIALQVLWNLYTQSSYDTTLLFFFTGLWREKSLSVLLEDWPWWWLDVALGSAEGGVFGVASVQVSFGAWPPASTNSPSRMVCDPG